MKLARRDETIGILRAANIAIGRIEERCDGEVRIEIPHQQATEDLLNSIPADWWAIRGVVS
jgi:hypothetical protein